MALVERKIVDVQEEVQKILPKTLVKDLTENERICPVCYGLGIRVINNVFGIQGDESEAGKRECFPYNNQAFTFCRSCSWGVQRLCPYCGKPYAIQTYFHCDCDGQKEADRAAAARKWNEILSKAVEVDEEDVPDTILYCKEIDQCYESIDEFQDDWVSNEYDELYDERPDRLWVCDIEKIAIDAGSVVDMACDGLHEDAVSECDANSLQKLLDDWCAEQTGTTTYYPCYERYVKIDWDK